MRHNELCSLEVLHEILEPFSGLNVQVVGRLVKKNHVNAVESDKLSSKSKFGLFTAGEFVDVHVHGVLVQS